MGWMAPLRHLGAKVLVGREPPANREPSMNEITTVGLDLAKNVFQVHGVDAEGTTVLRKQLRRAQLLAFFSRLPRCLVGMEAFATAHYWARELRALGHEVRLMPVQYVKAYVNRNKNDAADAEAICEAFARPTMRFVPAKTAEQQTAVLAPRPGATGTPAHDAGECLARASCGVRSDRPAGLTQCWEADCCHPGRGGRSSIGSGAPGAAGARHSD